MREIALSGGEPPLRVYDTSGPQGCDVHEGLASLRRSWILARGVEESGVRSQESGDVTKGLRITPDSRLSTPDRGGANLIPESLRRLCCGARVQFLSCHTRGRGWSPKRWNSSPSGKG